MAKLEPSIEISPTVLETLHRIYRQRSDVQGQLDRGPKQIQAGAAMVAKARQAVDDATAAIKRAKMSADQKQLQLKEREQRVVTLKGKLNTAASNREFDSFREQIAADEQANSVLSDEILEALEQIDVLEADRRNRQQELVDQEDEQAKRIARVTEQLEICRQDLTRVESQRVEAEKEVPDAIRTEYQRLVHARGEEALAPIDGDTCGGCFQTLTTQLMSQILLARLVRCPTCGAFLYRRGETRVGGAT